MLILRCAHAPNLARGVVCKHKYRIGSYGDKNHVENRVGLPTTALWDPSLRFNVSGSVKSEEKRLSK